MYQLLLECYRSGQMSEAAWQEHLNADPELRRWYNEQSNIIKTIEVIHEY